MPILTPDAIKQFRKDRHISQKELAKRAGVAQSSISRLENGEGSLADDTEAKVLEYISRTTADKFPAPTNADSPIEALLTTPL